MTECFRLWTSHHQTIVAQSADGELVHIAQDRLTDQTPLLVWWPSPHGPNAVLIGAGAGIPMRDMTGFPISQRLIGVTLVTMGDQVALSITPGRYFCAPPIDTDVVSVRVIFGRTEPQGWEMFELKAAPDASLPANLADVFDLVRPFLLGPHTADRFPLPVRPVQTSQSAAVPQAQSRNWLFSFFQGRSAPPKPSAEPMAVPLMIQYHLVAQALYGIIPTSQRQEIAAALYGQDVATLQAGNGASQDPWLQHGLPDLRRWLEKPDRQPVRVAAIGRELDVIAKAGQGGTSVSLGHLSAASLRKLVAPRRTCCAITTARNEGLYFLEWIAHHKLIGIDHLFIYSNMNDDGSDELLDALARTGEISWINNDLDIGVSAQDKAYSHALSLLPDTLDFEWSAIIDLDEFIMLDGGRFATIADYLAWQQRKPTDAIGLGWLIYGANGQRGWEDVPVVARFPRPAGDFSSTIKTICRTNLFFHSQPHFPITDVSTKFDYRDSAGGSHLYDPNSGSTAATRGQGGHSAWVAHYVYKSVDEFLWKCSRNRGNFPTTTSRDPMVLTNDMAKAFLNAFDTPGSVIQPPQPSYHERLEAEITRLHRLPGVTQAMGKIVSLYHGRMLEIRRQFHESLTASGEPSLMRLADLIAAPA